MIICCNWDISSPPRTPNLSPPYLFWGSYSKEEEKDQFCSGVADEAAHWCPHENRLNINITKIRMAHCHGSSALEEFNFFLQFRDRILKSFSDHIVDWCGQVCTTIIFDISWCFSVYGVILRVYWIMFYSSGYAFFHARNPFSQAYGPYTILGQLYHL